MHCFKVPPRLRADSDGLIKPLNEDLRPAMMQHKGEVDVRGNPTKMAAAFADSSSGKSVGLLANHHSISTGPLGADSDSAKAVMSHNLSSEPEEEEKTSSRHSGGPKFHPAQLQAMMMMHSRGGSKFGISKSTHGRGGGANNRSRYSHNTASQKSHHSRHSRNLSVSSLPTITEERNKRVPSSFV